MLITYLSILFHFRNLFGLERGSVYVLKTIHNVFLFCFR